MGKAVKRPKKPTPPLTRRSHNYGKSFWQISAVLSYFTMFMASARGFQELSDRYENPDKLLAIPFEVLQDFSEQMMQLGYQNEYGVRTRKGERSLIIPSPSPSAPILLQFVWCVWHDQNRDSVRNCRIHAARTACWQEQVH